MAPLPNSPTGIWTTSTSRKFHGNVNTLSKKLKQGQSPRKPKDYRTIVAPRNDSDVYTLAYEDELHLADHFAFLAHYKEGVEFVSAVAIEEIELPPAFVVRLASNHTPTKHVVKGLSRILKIVQEHAGEGKHREEYKSRLLKEVICLSQGRIQSRLRSSHWKKPRHIHGPHKVPLHARIDRILAGISPPSQVQQTKSSSLRAALLGLLESLQAVDAGALEDQAQLLEAVIQRSYEVSHQGSSTLLRTNLQQLGLTSSIYESRDVLEIDKLSKYLELCHDLIRLSRQQRTRPFCRNIALKICTAFPPSQPPGAQAPCFVHGEVQLVLYYESRPTKLPPRAIGSSKSACFLCDLFIEKHRKFGISHSHMKLYPMWTVPDSTWMNVQQRQRFQGIIYSMSIEVGTLLNKKFYTQNTIIESRAHLQRLIRDSPIASSAASPVPSEGLVVPSPRIAVQTISSVSSQNSLAPSELAQGSIFYFQDLPITKFISASTTSCTLLVGRVDYIFDLEDVGSSKLQISNGMDSEDRMKCLRVDVRDQALDAPMSINPESDCQSLAFSVHDRGAYEIRVVFSWSAP